jgi:hypothetical protein
MVNAALTFKGKSIVLGPWSHDLLVIAGLDPAIHPSS